MSLPMKRPEPAPPSGRYRRIQFSLHFLLDLCKEGSGVRCLDGIPEDASVEECFFSDGGLTITVRSEEFSPVGEGEKIPTITPTFTDEGL